MANTVDKVIKIAKAEVGYLEKKTNAQLDSKTANAGRNNYTKYWRDMAAGMNGQAWCNCFVNWCFTKAYGKEEAKKLLCSTNGWSYYTPTSAGYFKTKGQWHNTPQKGDIIYFKNSQRICHVGIVYKVDGSKVYTIEGNTSSASGVIPNGGGVAKKSYTLGYSGIAGYGRPKYDKESSSASSSFKEYKVKIIADVLNIREGAGTDYKVVGTTKKNDKHTITKEKDGWGKVATGWISLKYTKKI